MISTEQNELRDYYWRKGIPSLILAFVTVFLAGYSYLFVQPNIRTRYQTIVENNLVKLGFDTEASQDSGLSNGGKSGDETDDARLAKRQLLEETHLCLRRQIIWNNQDDLPRYRSALVSNALADWYLDEARRVSRDVSASEGLNDRVRDLVSRSRGERQKAAEAMRAAAKLAGPLFGRSSLWVVRNQLYGKPDAALSELNEMETRVRDVLSKFESSGSPNEREKMEAGELLSQILVLGALSPVNDMGRADRIERLASVLPLVSEEGSKNVLSVRWAAAARWVIEPDRAKQTAWQGTQAFWEKRNDGQLPVDTIAAVFECILLSGGLKEAQSFLVEQLQSTPSFEQQELRYRAVSACVRNLYATALRESELTALESQSISPILSIAIQLQPESEELLTLLELISRKSEAESLFKKVVQSIEVGNTGLETMLAVLAVATEESEAGVHFELPERELAKFMEQVKKQPALGVLVSRFSIRHASKHQELANRWIVILKRITQASPELAVAWADLAKLYLTQSDFEEALKCFEYLATKLPENEEIQSAIQQTREKLIK